MMQVRRQHRGSATAFTLVELLVVVSIITLLIAILLPALSKARRSAKLVLCASHLHQLGVALTVYDNEYHRLPLHTHELDTNNNDADPHKIRSDEYDARPEYTPYLPIEMLLCPMIDNEGWTPGSSNSGSIYVQYALGAGFFGDVVNGYYRDWNRPWTRLSDTYSYNGRPLNVLAADLMRYVGPSGIAQGTNQINHAYGLDDFYRFAPSGNWTVQSWDYDTNDVRYKYSMNTLFADGSVNTTSSDPEGIRRARMPAGTGNAPRWLVNLP